MTTLNFQSLIDLYPLSDDMMRFELAKELENSFFDRLHTILVKELDPDTFQDLFAQHDITPEEWFARLYAYHDDNINIIIEETWNDFKQEFLDNLPQ